MITKYNELLKRRLSVTVLSYVILAAATLNIILIGGKRRTFGIFISAFRSTFNNTSMTELNWVGDSYSALAFFVMPFFTTLLLQYRYYQLGIFVAMLFIFVSCMLTSVVTQAWQLFLTHTLLHGIGSSLILSVSALIIGEYFHKNHPRHVLATSLTTGGPYGSLIFGPLYGFMVQHYGWRFTFRVIGFVFLVEMILAVLFYVPKEQEENSQDLKETTEGYQEMAPPAKKSFKVLLPSWAHIMENKQILLWVVDRIVTSCILYGLLMNLTDFLRRLIRDKSVENLESGARINLMMGVGESIMFTISAIIGDRIRGKLPFFHLIGAAFTLLMIILIKTVSDSPSAIVTFAIVLGAAAGVGNCMLYASSEEIVLLHGSIALPFSNMMMAVGMIVAPLFSGLVIDFYGYMGLFSSLIILASIRMLCLIGINVILYLT